MIIGQKLRELRESKNLSQGDVEQRTGLLRCYTSRIENGHTVPSVDTLERYARALEVPLYRFFTDGRPVKVPKLLGSEEIENLWGSSNQERSELRALAKALSRMDDPDRRLFMSMAQRMTKRSAKS